MMGLISWGRLIAAGTVLLALWGVVNWIDDYLAEKQQLRTDLTTATIELAEEKTLRSGLERELEIERAYQIQHRDLVDQVNRELSAQREHMRLQIDRLTLTERASTPAGREDLDRRAAERTRQRYDNFERLSNWSQVYPPDHDRPGVKRPGADDRLRATADPN